MRNAETVENVAPISRNDRKGNEALEPAAEVPGWLPLHPRIKEGAPLPKGLGAEQPLIVRNTGTVFAGTVFTLTMSPRGTYL